MKKRIRIEADALGRIRLRDHATGQILESELRTPDLSALVGHRIETGTVCNDGSIVLDLEHEPS